MKSLGYSPPLYIERAEDCYLYDIDGYRYVDWINNACTLVLGHSPKGVVNALTDVVQNGIVFGAPNTFEKPIAEHICQRIPSVEKVRFTNSGTEAVMNALRLARAYTGKPKIAKFEGASTAPRTTPKSALRLLSTRPVPTRRPTRWRNTRASTRAPSTTSWSCPTTTPRPST